MKLTITTGDIRVEYEDEYAQITEEAKKRIIELIKEIKQQWDPNSKQH